MRADAVARLVDGTLSGEPGVEISGAEVDSRLVRDNDLFVALPGARADGHIFVGAALATAAAALVRRDVELPPPPPGRALIEVDDPLSAYHRLAAHDRQERSWRIAAITGSVGKTTTKDFLATLIDDRFVAGFSAGNRNSTLGLPAQLLSQAADTEVFVAEAGMSRAGELDLLGKILEPDLVLYTRIAPAHTEFFDGIRGIVEAKAELLSHLKPGGTVVLNAEDPYQDDFRDRTSARVLRYGGPDADGRIEEQENVGLEGTRGILALPSGKAEFYLPLPGRHQVENFLAAATAADVLGLNVNEVAARAGELQAAAHRGRLLTAGENVTIVDDSYNASPAAVARALELLASSPGRRIAVLGEMFELGDTSDAAHHEAGMRAAGACDLLFAIGGNSARILTSGALDAGMAPPFVHHLDDADAATKALRDTLQPGDVVLIKGSRGVGLDRTVTALTERGG